MQSLSDSGVYQTLALKRTLSIEYGRGIYHDNWYFTIVLSSTHLQSTNQEQEFHLIVMKSLDDSVYSFAIDEFPLMKSESINAFWKQMVDRHKALRESSFEQIEREELALDLKQVGVTASLQELMEEFNGKGDEELSRIVERGVKERPNTGTEGPAETRAREREALFAELANDVLDARWDQQMLLEQEKYDQHVGSLGGGKSTEL